MIQEGIRDEKTEIRVDDLVDQNLTVLWSHYSETDAIGLLMKSCKKRLKKIEKSANSAKNPSGPSIPAVEEMK